LPYSHLDDKELFDRLRKAELSEAIKTDEKWQLFGEMRKRTIDNVIDEFALRTEPDDTVKIIQLQTILKLYKFKFDDALQENIISGEYAFNEIKERDAISNIT